MMKKEINSRLIMALAMAVFGTVGVFVRGIPLPSGEIALWRALLAVVMIGILLVLRGENIDFRSLGREAVLLFASGAALGINWMLLFEAYKRTTVSLATLAYYFAPVLVTLLCPFLFRERMTVKQIVCVAASTLGVCLLVGVSGAGGGNHLLGILLGISAAIRS